MKELQFATLQMDVKKHHYANSIQSGTPSRTKVLRLAQEQGRWVFVALFSVNSY